jgi:hypothetical protein
VAARNEQYAIQDWSNNRKTQWQGSLNRNRNLVLVGEVRQSVDNSIFQYMECYMIARWRSRSTSPERLCRLFHFREGLLPWRYPERFDLGPLDADRGCLFS